MLFQNTTLFEASNSSLRTAGFARVMGHHGEFLQGAFLTRDTYERALVTCPCPLFWTSVAFYPVLNRDIRVYPRRKLKAAHAARLTLDNYGLTDLGGDLVIHSSVPEKVGLGSSTQDTVASIIAVMNATNYCLSNSEIARLAVEIEMASDPLVWPIQRSSFLFAQRIGEIIEDFGGPAPHILVVGFCTDRLGVETINLPLPNYSREELEEFETLRKLMRHGIELNNCRLVAEASTRSALINQKYLPKPGLEKILEIAGRNGAIGIQISHSGSVVGILFDPHNTDLKIVYRTCDELYIKLGYRHAYHFTI